MFPVGTSAVVVLRCVFLPRDATLARYMPYVCLSVTQSVCHKSAFYWNGCFTDVSRTSYDKEFSCT